MSNCFFCVCPCFHLRIVPYWIAIGNGINLNLFKLNFNPSLMDDAKDSFNLNFEIEILFYFHLPRKREKFRFY